MLALGLVRSPPFRSKVTGSLPAMSVKGSPFVLCPISISPIETLKIIHQNSLSSPAFNMPANCEVAPDEVSSDAGIAGAGVSRRPF